MAEDKFEQAVIEKLKSEGWDYLTDYSGVTVNRLYDHWRDILNANNRKRLEDTPALMSRLWTGFFGTERCRTPKIFQNPDFSLKRRHFSVFL